MVEIRPGAGFVVCKRYGAEVKFLGLVGPEFHRKRCNGTFDIPKGIVDFGETEFEAAARELREEAGYVLSEAQLLSGPFQDSFLTMWLVLVDSDPVITPNPETGIIEHEGYQWLDPGDLLNDCYNYLRPTIRWATIEALKMF